MSDHALARAAPRMPILLYIPRLVTAVEVLILYFLETPYEHRVRGGVCIPSAPG